MSGNNRLNDHANLSTLPPEIIQLITGFLEQYDVASLRSVNRRLNTMTADTFAAQSFATIKTDLSYKSLLKILKRSESKLYARHVICLRMIYTPEGRYGQGFDWHRSPAGCVQIDTSPGAYVLEDLLCNRLLRCRSILIHTHDEFGPRFITSYMIPSEVVGMILAVMAKNDLKMQSFAVQSNHQNVGRLHSSSLQRSLCRAPKFMVSWSQIETLRLDYGITEDQYEWALYLISSAPPLRRLTLSFYEDSPDFLRRLRRQTKLTKLEELTLRRGHCTQEDLSAILQQNSLTLRSLSLRFITLTQGNWSALFNDMIDQYQFLQTLETHFLKGSGDKRVGFSEFRSYGLASKPELRYPSGRLKCQWRRVSSADDLVQLDFRNKAELIVGVSYTGPSTRAVLTSLALEEDEEA